MIPAQCYERTVQLRLATGETASGFTVTRNGHEWLVTALHNVDGLQPSDIVPMYRGTPIEAAMEPVLGVQHPADIAVFRLDRAITPNLTLEPTMTGITFGQDVYFLGFPYGRGLHIGGLTQLAFVKKAILSATNHRPDGLIVLHLDGINNPGFSGGPVVYQVNGTNDWNVAGVVSSWATERLEVLGDDGEPNGLGHVDANTGIIAAWSVEAAVAAIDLAS